MDYPTDQSTNYPYRPPLWTTPPPNKLKIINKSLHLYGLSNGSPVSAKFLVVHCANVTDLGLGLGESYSSLRVCRGGPQEGEWVHSRPQTGTVFGLSHIYFVKLFAPPIVCTQVSSLGSCIQAPQIQLIVTLR